MKTSKIAAITSLTIAMASLHQAQAKVIYTGEIGKKVIGYNGPTPLNITVTNGKITHIEVLDNEESPKYLKKATSRIFPKYIGKSVKEALSMKVDAVTGATYSSKAILENLKLGLKQAQAPKKHIP